MAHPSPQSPAILWESILATVVTLTFKSVRRGVDAAGGEGVLWVGAGAEEVGEQVDAVADVDS